MRGATRPVTAAAVLVGSVLAPAGVALADAAGPTDYVTTITSIEPATDSIEMGVVGGDSFLQLTVDEGVDVVVLGYQQEPYLHVRRDGTVEENQRSPAAYLNDSRQGGGDVPAGADPELPPDWEPVGSGGTYSWHDHRAHWMSPAPPADTQSGEEIQASTVPLIVDGAPVTVRVSTAWLAPPSRLPLAIGAAAGAALVLLMLLRRSRTASALLGAACGAGGIGFWQYWSLPAETGPLRVWWVLPAVAAGVTLVALALGRRMVSHALVLLAALQLAIWVWLRREGAFHAVIPTDAPMWLDRGVMAATAVVAGLAAVGAAIGMFRLPADAED